MFHKKRKINKKKKQFFKTKIMSFCLFCLFLLGLYIFVVQFETQVLPTALKVSQKYATNIVSQQINKSVEKVINEMKLVTDDFFNKSVDYKTDKSYLDVNTILINSVCTNISDELSARLKNIKDTKIELPVGVFSGISAFSDFGPYFNVYVTSIGDAVVDYETTFQSVGINQINFQVYLNINCSVSIINPMYKKDIEISRKLTLVNTVFNGEVPNTYLGGLSK